MKPKNTRSRFPYVASGSLARRAWDVHPAADDREGACDRDRHRRQRGRQHSGQRGRQHEGQRGRQCEGAHCAAWFWLPLRGAMCVAWCGMGWRARTWAPVGVPHTTPHTQRERKRKTKRTRTRKGGEAGRQGLLARRELVNCVCHLALFRPALRLRVVPARAAQYPGRKGKGKTMGKDEERPWGKTRKGERGRLV